MIQNLLMLRKVTLLNCKDEDLLSVINHLVKQGELFCVVANYWQLQYGQFSICDGTAVVLVVIQAKHHHVFLLQSLMVIPKLCLHLDQKQKQKKQSKRYVHFEQLPSFCFSDLPCMDCDINKVDAPYCMHSIMILQCTLTCMAM